MKLESYKHYNNFYILPALYVTYEKDYYLSIDMIWLKWGITLIIKDK